MSNPDEQWKVPNVPSRESRGGEIPPLLDDLQTGDRSVQLRDRIGVQDGHIDLDGGRA
jgi:hypothetical protein